MRRVNERLDGIARFYRSRADGEPNLFQIWEDGGARGDSVTPSTYSRTYRQWMVDKLTAELERGHGTGMLSLGCGNATVEREIVRAGYRVLGVDAMAEAVDLATAKGVEAVRADIATWRPEATWPLIYMDGVLGHLFDPVTGLRTVLERVRSWLAPGVGAIEAALVASNDATVSDEPALAAPGVNGFHWLSGPFMASEAVAAGFDEVMTERFDYQRPRSGHRVRAVVTARVRFARGVPTCR